MFPRLFLLLVGHVLLSLDVVLAFTHEISRLLVAFACPVSYFFTPVTFSCESSLACVSVSSFAFLSFSFALALS